MNFKDTIVPKKHFFVFLLILLVLRVLLIALYPNPSGDGAIYLSHTFTIINGHLFQNDFIKGYIPVFNFPYFYGLLNAPFYLLSFGTWFQTYSILFWNIIWSIAFLAGAYLLMKKRPFYYDKFSFFALVFLLSVYSNSTRSEIFILPFLAFLLFGCFKAFEKSNNIFCFLIIPLLLVIIGLMHPVGGVFACVLIFIYALSRSINFYRIIIVFAITFVMLTALYLPVILIDYNGWLLNFVKLGVNQKTHSLFNFSLFLKFLYYNPAFGLAAIIVFINAANRKKEALIWIPCFLVIAYFQRSYYFPYLFVLLLWRLCDAPSFNIKPVWRFIAVACFAYGFIFGYVFPLAQQLENRKYGEEFKNIQAFIKDKVDSDAHSLIWVTPETAMPVIDKRNIRVHWEFILSYKDYMPLIDTSSVFFLTNKNQIDYIQQFAFVKNTHLEISEIINPVKGLFTLSSHFKRSDSLGLWQVKVIADSLQNLPRFH